MLLVWQLRELYSLKVANSRLSLMFELKVHIWIKIQICYDISV